MVEHRTRNAEAVPSSGTFGSNSSPSSSFRKSTALVKQRQGVRISRWAPFARDWPIDWALVFQTSQGSLILPSRSSSGHGAAWGGRLTCNENTQQGSMPWCSTNLMAVVDQVAGRLTVNQDIVRFRVSPTAPVRARSSDGRARSS